MSYGLLFHNPRSAILVQALDDASSLSNSFKVLDNYDTLLKRDTIQADAEPKMPRLLQMFAQGASPCDEHS